MAKIRKVLVEYEEEPFFDFGACVVAWLLVGGCALGASVAFFL